MHLDSRRLEISSRLDRSQRSSLGQFLTPTSVADFMAGLYVAVRRFSSKEEKRRVVAAVVPESLAVDGLVSFENHLNVFHAARCGLSADLARGLAAYLNSARVDRYFRLFSGHTQVNATDLRRLRYPSREALIELGQWVAAQADRSADALERRIEALV